MAEQNDAEGLARLLEANDDVACAIIEPTGAHGAQLPIDPKFLTALRELTRQHGVVLIFDEVVTGFRVSPGGAQAEYGIRPDLTTLAKILAGGLPGGAVAGRKDILDLLDFQITKAADREKITHQGTFNANPLSAAAGVAALEIVGDDRRLCAANRYADTMRRRINEVFEEEHVPWAAYGMFSNFHFFTNPDRRAIIPTRFDPLGNAGATPDRQAPGRGRAQIPAGDDDRRGRFQRQPGGVTSATHGEAELEDTVTALRNDHPHAEAGGRDLAVPPRNKRLNGQFAACCLQRVCSGALVLVTLGRPGKRALLDRPSISVQARARVLKTCHESKDTPEFWRENGGVEICCLPRAI